MSNEPITTPLQTVEGLTVYDGYLDPDIEHPTFPYALVIATTPRITERSHAGRSLMRERRWQIIIAGLTPDSVFTNTLRIEPLLEGQRIDGQLVTVIPNYLPIQEDQTVTRPDGAHPFYTSLHFRVSN